MWGDAGDMGRCGPLAACDAPFPPLTLANSRKGGAVCPPPSPSFDMLFRSMQALVAFSITQALDGPTASYLGCTTDAPSCVSVCCGLRVCVLWPGEWRVAVCACVGPVCPGVHTVCVHVPRRVGAPKQKNRRPESTRRWQATRSAEARGPTQTARHSATTSGPPPDPPIEPRGRRERTLPVRPGPPAVRVSSCARRAAPSLRRGRAAPLLTQRTPLRPTS